MAQQEVHLVTGGGGYPGYHLAKALATLGHTVLLLDVRPPVEALPDNISFYRIDLTNKDEVSSVFSKHVVDCVYHMASYGMSGREMMNQQRIVTVNVTGTQTILEACRMYGVSRLVYTSTYNVVFGGQQIVNGDESLPYFPLDKHPDYYSSTKAMAEQLVLKANNSDNEGKILRTCALRLAGVYGPGEQRHLPRIVSYIERGLFKFTYGDGIVDFLHVDNLVQAHIKAGQALTKDQRYIAAGQVYFISDGKPINNFEFFRPLCEGLGYKFPRLKLPLSFVYMIAFVTEMVHSVFSMFYNFQPFLTRAEVFKTGVTHWFSIQKAKDDLGYEPTAQNEMAGVVEWFIMNGRGRKARPRSALATLLFDCVLSVLFILLVLSLLPKVA